MMYEENNYPDEKTQPRVCAECQQELDLGVDCMRVQQGVVGPRGFVPLDKDVHLCGYDCAKSYFGDSTEVVHLSRNIP